jgi:hypothetical protein
MADDLFTMSSLQAEQYYLTTSDRVFFRIEPGGRIFIDDQETSDDERIGARFREWAKELCPEASPLASNPTDGSNG